MKVHFPWHSLERVGKEVEHMKETIVRLLDRANDRQLHLIFIYIEALLGLR